MGTLAWDTISLDNGDIKHPPEGAYIEGFGVRLDRVWVEEDRRAVVFLDDISVDSDMSLAELTEFPEETTRKYAPHFERERLLKAERLAAKANTLRTVVGAAIAKLKTVDAAELPSTGTIGKLAHGHGRRPEE